MRQLPPGTRTDVDARRAQVDLFLALGRIQAVVQRRTAELFEAEGLGQITPAQSNVLMVVFQARRPITAREIARTLGVAEPTVSRFIKALERDGFVERTVFPTVPPGVEYALTPFGRELSAPLMALTRFALENSGRVDEARAAYDRKQVETATELQRASS